MIVVMERKRKNNTVFISLSCPLQTLWQWGAAALLYAGGTDISSREHKDL